MTKLTGQQIAESGLSGWAYLPEGLRTRVRTGSFATGLELVRLIGEAAEKADHHPDLDLRYTHLDVRLISHDVRAVTGRDLRMARQVAQLAASLGVACGTRGVSGLELALDSPAYASIRPFWQAVLAAEPRRDNDLADPAGVLPAVWFQQSGRDEPRQRWHPDVWVDPAEVPSRIGAALAAGGTLVSDQQAPAFWVLADAEGNQVCVCTWQSRPVPGQS